MRIRIRKLVSSRFPSYRDSIKRIEYKTKKYLISRFPPITISGFEEILKTRLGVGAGDVVMVHCSMDMLNTHLKAYELRDLILNIIGKAGSLIVPTFPHVPSVKWMESNIEFSVRRTVSGMGRFSESVRRHSESSRSLHPTKSVSCIGPISEVILNEHHKDNYAFGICSPFYRMIEHDVKVIGLGVPMSYLSLVHVVEDIYGDAYPVRVNLPNLFSKICEDRNKNNIVVNTYVHDMSVVSRADPEKFVVKYMVPTDYVVFNRFFSPFFSVDGRILFDTLKTQMLKGRTIYD